MKSIYKLVVFEFRGSGITNHRCWRGMDCRRRIRLGLWQGSNRRSTWLITFMCDTLRRKVYRRPNYIGRGQFFKVVLDYFFFNALRIGRSNVLSHTLLIEVRRLNRYGLLIPINALTFNGLLVIVSLVLRNRHLVIGRLRRRHLLHIV